MEGGILEMTRMTHSIGDCRRSVIGMASMVAGVRLPVLRPQEIRVGITMRMISENGQKYGQMVMDEIDMINAAGGINGNKLDVNAVLLNDECKSDKGVANANKLIFEHKVHLLDRFDLLVRVSLPIVDVTAKARGPPDHPPFHQCHDHPEGQRLGISGSGLRSLLRRRQRQIRGREHRHQGRLSLRRRRGLPERLRCHAGPDEVAVRRADPVYVAQVQEKEVDFRTHMQKIKSAGVDGIMVAALAETMARALIQSYEAGIPASVRRIGSSSASNAPVPQDRRRCRQGRVLYRGLRGGGQAPHRSAVQRDGAQAL